MSHYSGQPIVSEAAFIRRLPVCIDLKSRLLFDAIVMACDIITIEFRRLRDATLALAKPDAGVADLNVAAAISCCWSIVDQIHAMANLKKAGLRPGQSVGTLTSEFLAEARKYTLLRNKMDHIAQNLNNLARQSRPAGPLFGSLSYMFHNPEIDSPYRIICIHSGAIIHQQIVPIVNPIGKTFTLPVGEFQFSAFNVSVRFESVLSLLKEILEKEDPDFEQSIRLAAEEHCLKTGDNLDQLLEAGRGSLKLEMTFDVEGPADKQPPSIAV